MAINSVGYDGTINESQWSEMIKKIGTSDYGVVSRGDLQVWNAPNSGDRAVQVSAGKAWGHGVFDENTNSVTIQLDSVASGSRWDLIALRRNWTGAGGVTTLVKVNGTSAREIPASRQKSPGIIDDQPLALVQVSSGSASVTAVIDLRAWAGNGGMIVNNEMALTYLETLGANIYNCATGKKYNRIFGHDAQPMWTVGVEDGWHPLYGTHGAAFGGLPPAGSNFLIQAGSSTGYTDNSGYGRVIFPKPFPNGLLTVLLTNGDSYSTFGRVSFQVAGNPGVFGTSGGGDRNSVVYVSHDTINGGAVLRPNMLHRINWLAIGF